MSTEIDESAAGLNALCGLNAGNWYSMVKIDTKYEAKNTVAAINRGSFRIFGVSARLAYGMHASKGSDCIVSLWASITARKQVAAESALKFFH